MTGPQDRDRPPHPVDPGPTDPPGGPAGDGTDGGGPVAGGPAAVPAGVPGLRGSRGDLRSGVWTVLVLGLSGLLTAAGWLWLAPRVQLRVTDADGGLEVVGGGLVSPELFVGADAVYVLLMAGLGLVAGLVAWSRRARRGVVTLGALAAGMLLASLVTWTVGALLGQGPGAQALRTPGTVVTTAVDLGASAALAVGPFTAVLVYLVATVLVARDDLGRPDTAVPTPAGPAAAPPEQTPPPA